MKSHKNKVRKSHRADLQCCLPNPLLHNQSLKALLQRKKRRSLNRKGRAGASTNWTGQTCRAWRCPGECSRAQQLCFLCLHTLKQFLSKLYKRQNFVYLFKALLLAQGTLHGGCGQSTCHDHSVSPLPLICGKHPSLVVLGLPLDSRAEGFPDSPSGGHLGTSARGVGNPTFISKSSSSSITNTDLTPLKPETCRDLRPAGTGGLLGCETWQDLPL